MVNFKRPESVLVMIYNQLGEVLLLKRRDNPEFWQSVTGSMMDEETLAFETAKRELFEETGLTDADGTMIDCELSHWYEIYPHWRHRYAEGVTQNLEHVFCFEMQASREIQLSSEHTEFVWLPKAQAVEKTTSITNKQAIERFAKS